MDSKEIYTAVLDRYSALSSDPTHSSSGYSKSVAQFFGYSKEDLASIPAESNLGLSCGNPLAITSLREGETVIDLGSGAGFDVFLAAKKIGPTGRAIGVDMNKDMLDLAEQNKAKSGASTTEFVAARITSIPLADGIADVVLSNCVVNLVPEDEKQLVFNEVFRLLKPGGRLAISDILAKKPLLEKLQKCAAAYVGCVAGASLVSQYETYLHRAGFTDVLIKDAEADLNVYLDALSDGTSGAKDTYSAAQRNSACCSSTTTDGPTCCCSKKAAASCCNGGTGDGNCCDAASKDGGCCTTSEKAGNELDLAHMAAGLREVNLNDWVGSYKIFAVKSSDGPAKE